MSNLNFVADGDYVEIVDTHINEAVGEISLSYSITVYFYEGFTLVSEELVEIAEYMKGIRK